MYLHPRVRPGWCLLILALILVGIGLIVLISSFFPNFRNSLIGDNVRVIQTASYACFITGGILAVCAGVYTYLNWTAVQKQLELAKVKQEMIQNEIRKRSRKIISDSVKQHYRQFADLYDACQPMHRMEIPDKNEDDENTDIKAIEAPELKAIEAPEIPAIQYHDNEGFRAIESIDERPSAMESLN